MQLKALTKGEFSNRLSEFCELSRACFTAHIDENIVKQRYIDNPYDDLLMYVAEDEGRIVANYSALPVFLNIEGKKYKAAMSLNIMTHPDYEGRGLFVKLATALSEDMKNRGYAINYVFPNYLSNGIFCAKLGWQDVKEIPTLELSCDKFKRSSVITEESWDNLKCSPKGKIEIVREKEYIDWRYKNNAEKEYTPMKIDDNNWLIYHLYGDEINITEMHHDSSPESIKKLIGAVVDWAIDNSKTKITTWSGLNTVEHSTLERIGFLNRSPIRYFACKNLAYDGKVDIYDPRNWNIFMGDDNVY